MDLEELRRKWEAADAQEAAMSRRFEMLEQQRLKRAIVEEELPDEWMEEILDDQR